MNDNIIADSTLEDLQQGYRSADSHFTCLCCGEHFEKGIIYPVDGLLYDAEKYVQVHIRKVHESVFAYWINQDKRVTGLSDIQRALLQQFYLGKRDREIQSELDAGSTSTIRNHRFQLREKERQAKIFLTLMGLLRRGDPKQVEGSAVAQSPTRLRGGIREDDTDAILKKYFPNGTQGPLLRFPQKQKERRIILQAIADRFTIGEIYHEKAVNQILEPVYADFVMIRRYLIEYNLLNRVADGSEYWRSAANDEERVQPVDRRRELKQQSKETKTIAGIYQIRNTQNHKVLVDSTPNINSLNGQRFQLEQGGHRNTALQQEWNKFGKDAFVFEVLERIEKKQDGDLTMKDTLKKQKEKWLQQLQPFGDRGYN